MNEIIVFLILTIVSFCSYIFAIFTLDFNDRLRWLRDGTPPVTVVVTLIAFVFTGALTVVESLIKILEV